MNVLFLTLVEFESFEERNIYTDLLREFIKNGHKVCAVSPVEKRKGQPTHLIEEKGSFILKIQIGNTQKTNIIEKGISTVLIEPTIKKSIKKYFADVKFDLLLYSTPPITLVGAIEYVKKRDHAKTYLLLKDIFPQNAVDIGLMKTTGPMGILYRHFRKKEKKLYQISERIGCMSPANARYIIDHNPELDPRRVEVCPNSIKVTENSIAEPNRLWIRGKYHIPCDRKVFVYGGNLGKPQGIPFLIECLRKCRDLNDVLFLIIGSGTEAHLLANFIQEEKPGNVMFLNTLPKEDYETLVESCDVGLIFLDHRFTIPNFPSRILSYMKAGIPVLAATDPNTDMGRIISEGRFGWQCESNDPKRFHHIIEQILHTDLAVIGSNGRAYLEEHYTVSKSYGTIMNQDR